jgi:hypothetical protein
MFSRLGKWPCEEGTSRKARDFDLAIITTLLEIY